MAALQVAEIVLIGVLVAAIAAAAVTVILAARAGAKTEGRVKEAAARFADALGNARELGASLDRDQVVARTLDAVAALPGIDVVLLEVIDPAGERIRAARGVSADEAERAFLQLPANSNVRAMDVVYRYRLDHAAKGAAFLRAGLVVPLAAEGRQVGTLAAFTREASTEFPEETVVALERLAQRAGPAVDNAQRFVQARQLADIDWLTGLFNRGRFHELLAIEVERATRYHRRLALIVLDLDNFRAINDRIGHLPGDAVLAEVAGRVQAAVRIADVACRVGGDEFGVIMPESGLAEAELLANRIARAVADRPLDHGGTVEISAGVAELTVDDDANELFERADEALYQAKQAGKGRTVASG